MLMVSYFSINDDYPFRLQLFFFYSKFYAPKQLVRGPIINIGFLFFFIYVNTGDSCIIRNIRDIRFVSVLVYTTIVHIIFTYCLLCQWRRALCHGGGDFTVTIRFLCGGNYTTAWRRRRLICLLLCRADCSIQSPVYRLLWRKFGRRLYNDVKRTGGRVRDIALKC